MPESPDPQPSAPAHRGGARRLWKALTARPDGGQVVIAVLIAALGFAVVYQVRGDEEDQLANARRSDLVQILSNLNMRSAQLEDEVSELRTVRQELQSGADSDAVALAQTEQRAKQLAVLAGTAPAEGPGIVVTIDDPAEQVRSRHVLFAVQELRIAGAEAMQIEGGSGVSVRIVASTYFLDQDADLIVDGVLLTRPYAMTAIGNPNALASTISFPTSMTEIQRVAVVEEHDSVSVDTLRDPTTPQYARPAPDDD